MNASISLDIGSHGCGDKPQPCLAEIVPHHAPQVKRKHTSSHNLHIYLHKQKDEQLFVFVLSMTQLVLERALFVSLSPCGSLLFGGKRSDRSNPDPFARIKVCHWVGLPFFDSYEVSSGETLTTYHASGVYFLNFSKILVLVPVCLYSEVPSIFMYPCALHLSILSLISYTSYYTLI